MIFTLWAASAQAEGPKPKAEEKGDQKDQPKGKQKVFVVPANKISMLTTYNGQKHLIRDVIAQRCLNNPLIGPPHKVRE